MKLFEILILILLLSMNSYSKELKTHIINIEVAESGFQPNKIDVAPGTPVTLKITRKTDSTCATAIQIPSRNVKKNLPLNKAVEIKLGKLAVGEIKFGCGMKMMESGVIYVK